MYLEEIATVNDNATFAERPHFGGVSLRTIENFVYLLHVGLGTIIP